MMIRVFSVAVVLGLASSGAFAGKANNDASGNVVAYVNSETQVADIQTRLQAANTTGAAQRFVAPDGSVNVVFPGGETFNFSTPVVASYFVGFFGINLQ